MVGVYKITNLITGEFYIGRSKHVEERWKEHFCKGYGAMHSRRFQEAIEKYGPEGFSFQVIEECSEEELNEKEKFWINALCPVYNTIYDGHKVSAETRAKISKSLTGLKQSEETKEKRKASIRERHKLIPQTNAWMRKKIGVDDFGDIKIFESVKAAAGYLAIRPDHLCKCLKRGWRCRGRKVWYVV